MTAFTREQIDAIEPGKTWIAWGNGSIFGDYRQVVGIHAKEDDRNGKLFVCGYTKFSETSRISFSLKEGEDFDGSFYRIRQGAPT